MGMANVVSVREGRTSLDRRVIMAASAAVLPPDLNAGPRFGFPLNGADYMTVYARLNGGASGASVIPYFWNEITELWLPDQVLSFTTTTLLQRVLVQKETRVAFEVTTVSGGGTLDLWAGRSNVGALTYS